MRVAKDLLLFDSKGRPCIGIEEAAKRRDISAWALRKRIRLGHVEAVIVGGRKVVPVDAIEKFQPDRAKSDRARAHPPFSRKNRGKRKRREVALAS